RQRLALAGGVRPLAYELLAEGAPRPGQARAGVAGGAVRVEGEGAGRAGPDGRVLALAAAGRLAGGVGQRAAHQADAHQRPLRDFLGVPVVEVDEPGGLALGRLVRAVGGPGAAPAAVAAAVGEEDPVHRPAVGERRAVVDDPAELLQRGHPPVVPAAEGHAVDERDVGLRVAVEREATARGGRGVGAGVAAVVLTVRVEPRVAPLVVPGAGGFVELDLPQLPGEVVAGAGPVPGAGSQGGVGRQLAAVVGDLGEVEAAGAVAGLGEDAVGGGGVAAEAGVVAGEAGRGARGLLAVGVVARRLAGVVAGLGGVAAPGPLGRGGRAAEAEEHA